MVCDSNRLIEAQTWTYEIEKDNSGIVNINDPLLNTDASTKERAMSEFLKNAYVPKVITFGTYLIDLKINDVINVRGLPYLVKSLVTSLIGNVVTTTVRAQRYE